MAYASKYYDPDKAHAYYMKHRKLKGYEDRYGGSRGDGTSAATTGVIQSKSGNRNGSSVSGVIRSSNSNRNNRNGVSVSGVIGSSNSNNRNGVSVSGVIGSSNSNQNSNIKRQIENLQDSIKKDRDKAIEKSNKEVDDAVLNDVKRLIANIKRIRESGRKVSNQELLSRINSLLGKAKKTKIKARQKYISEYKQRYNDEIEKLRSNESR